jgi:glyoxylase-like metal-dependent hydrolase (beta-lactamase superfamily II)
MYVLTDSGAVMLDTPWDTTQFQPLLDSIRIRHHMNVVFCLSTHFHADRTAGLDFLKGRGVKTWSTELTRTLCIANHDHRAEYTFTDDTTFRIGNHEFQAYYPGKGHTRDNIVVWFDREKILYGGCLVKSTENDALGNVEDADLRTWPRTIQNVMDRFAHPRYVIPGHYGWADNGALEHTLELLRVSPVKN